jgi:hypothetical protein
MDYKKAWGDILDASGLVDYAAQSHGHDLLDGMGYEPNGDLCEAFCVLCRKDGVAGWGDVEPVLERFRTIAGFDKLRLPDEAINAIMARVDEDQGGAIKGVAHHSSLRRGTYTETWGTPIEILGSVTQIYGPITIDLASSAEHNTRVQAARYYSEADPCPPTIAVTPADVVWCNPPGPGWRVKEFWATWCDCVRQDAQGGFLVFNLDHLRQLAAPGPTLSVVILRKRLRFHGAPSSANFPSALIVRNGELFKGLGHVLQW